jgi:hypothetical protein
MTIESIKSAAITDFDALPPVFRDAGNGAVGMLRYVDGSAAITSGATATSTYQLVRLPPGAIVKSVMLWLDASSTTITGDLGVTFSTSATDGTPSADAPTSGVPVYANTTTHGSGTASAQSFFAYALALAAVVTPTDYTNQATNMNGSARGKRLWDNLGLTVPPAGAIDITWSGTSTAGAAAVINCSVEYVIG